MRALVLVRPHHARARGDVHQRCRRPRGQLQRPQL